MLALPLKGLAGSSVEPRKTRMYIDRFVDFAGKGKLDFLKEIERKVSHTDMSALVKLSSLVNKTTALYEAAKGGHSNVVVYLLTFEPMINSKNGSTNGTPLHAAVASGNEECVQALLRAGASPDARTNSGLTPKELAERKGLSHLFT